MTVEQGWDYTNEHDRKVAVDEQGRLRVVDESGGTGGGGGGDVVITDPATANQATVDASGNLHVAVAEPVTVDGVQTDALTDVELRAAPVPVSGPLTDAQLRAAAVPVSGPLTDAELRATPVPVAPDLGDTGYDGTVLGTNRVTITTTGAIPGADYTIAANPNRKFLSVHWAVDAFELSNPASPFGSEAGVVYLLGTGAAWFNPAHIYTGVLYAGDTLVVPDGYKGPVSFSTTMLTTGYDVNLQITEF